MARGPVRINQYDQRSTPQGRRQPYVRALEVGQGIAPGLSALARGLDDAAQGMLAREEDDARAYVSAAMARARARSSEIRRTAFQEAPDGWRGATDRVSREWTALREQELSQPGLTPSAQRFLNQAFDAYQPLLLEDVAGDEQVARQSWRVDTVRQAFRSESSAIAADPRLYGQAAAQQRELIGGMVDIDANQRRDLLAIMEEEFSTVAVAAMIERDPAGTLALLQGAMSPGSAEEVAPQIGELFGAQVTSARRTPERNAAVGGVANSMHLTGEAVDITVPAEYQGRPRAEIEADVRRRLAQAMPGAAFTEVIYEGDHIHIGWHGGQAPAPGGEAANPVANLSGSQRLALASRAQAELDRRASQARTQVREQVETARDLWRLGEQAPNAPTVDAVRESLGDAAAAGYEIDLQSANLASQYHSMTTEELTRLAAGPPVSALQGASDRERLDNIVRRRAAAAVLEQRADPMAYIARNGNIDTAGMMDAFQRGDWREIGARLRTRQAIATEHGRRLGLPANPLTGGETRVLRTMMDGMRAQDRQAAVSQFRAAITDPAAYRNFAASLYPDAPGAQLGMMVLGRSANFAGASNLTSETAARRLIEGSIALGSVQQQNTPGEQGADRPRRSFAMPSDADLRRAWIGEVGDAYRGAPQSEAAAFEAFRAAYAGTAIEAGDASGQFNSRFAREAAAIATGGVAGNGDEGRTLLPWGMSERAFESSIERGWDGMQGRLGGDIAERSHNRFDFVALGQGRYAVMTRQGAQALDQNGQPIVIRVPGPAR